MRSLEAYRQLRELNVDVLDTSDAAAHLGIKISHASRVLERLAEAGQIVRLKRGVWTFQSQLDPLRLPEYLTAPLPSYVSLQSALFYHGMISQIPHVVYAVSPARTRRWLTPLATVSIHHLCPSFFFGFESIGKSSIKMACPEKALLDCLYLSSVRSRLFASLPELDIPEIFDIHKVRSWLDQIPSIRMQTIIRQRLDVIIDIYKNGS